MEQKQALAGMSISSRPELNTEVLAELWGRRGRLLLLSRRISDCGLRSRGRRCGARPGSGGRRWRIVGVPAGRLVRRRGIIGRHIGGAVTLQLEVNRRDLKRHLVARV